MLIAEDGTTHDFFNKVGRVIGQTQDRLENNTFSLPRFLAVELYGWLAIAQLVVGATLSILSALRALLSENAAIIFDRSFRHIGYGLVGAWNYPPNLLLLILGCFSLKKLYRTSLKNWMGL